MISDKFVLNICISGRQGIGKTHLAAMIGNWIVNNCKYVDLFIEDNSPDQLLQAKEKSQSEIANVLNRHISKVKIRSKHTKR